MTKFIQLLLAVALLATVASPYVLTMSSAFVVPSPPTATTTTTTTRSTRSSSSGALYMSSTAKKTDKKQPGTAELDTKWEELGFEFRPTNSHVKVVYKDGAWTKPELVQVRKYARYTSTVLIVIQKGVER